MILGLGIDLCEVARMQDALDKGKFLPRFFSEHEQAYITSRGQGAAQSLAGHFAAKEAAIKAFGLGLVIPLTDIEIHHDEHGSPFYVLRGKAAGRMQAMGGQRMHLSITHTGETAAAVAVLEG